MLIFFLTVDITLPKFIGRESINMQKTIKILRDSWNSLRLYQHFARLCIDFLDLSINIFAPVDYFLAVEN